MSKAASKSSITVVVRSLARASLRAGGSSSSSTGSGGGSRDNGNRSNGSSSGRSRPHSTSTRSLDHPSSTAAAAAPPLGRTEVVSASTSSSVGLPPPPSASTREWPYHTRNRGNKARQHHQQAHASLPSDRSNPPQFSHLPSFWLQSGNNPSSVVGSPLFFGSSHPSSSDNHSSSTSSSSSSSASAAPSSATSLANSTPTSKADPSSYPLSISASTSASSIQDTFNHAPSFNDHSGTNSNFAHASQNSHLSDRNSSAHNLILHYGAFGIPKRPKSVKGKEREGLGDDPLADQITKMHEQLMSVQVGEDAYFVRHNSLGVADGVGGWAGRKGADPGLFAARLMHHCATEIEEYELYSDEPLSSLAFVSTCSASSSTKHSSSTRSSPSPSTPSSRSPSPTFDAPSPSPKKASPVSPTSSPQSTFATSFSSNSPPPSTISGKPKPEQDDPIEVLHRAWDNTLTEFFDLSLSGSSTALIALLKDDELRLANIGDCCCSIIRGNEYIFRSQEQQHSFNYPFQVGTNSQDTPRKDGQRFTIKVQKDDIVILSSDGLVDNLFDEDILEEVLLDQELSSSSENSSAKSAAGGSSGRMIIGDPQELSRALCSRAKAVSEDQRAVSSPFQQRANEEGIHFVGGKHDDISVLVAVIGDASVSPNTATTTTATQP